MPLTTFPFMQNIGGLNRRSGLTARKDDQADDILNMHPNRFGAWTSRPGYDNFNTTPVTGTPRNVGLFDYQRTVSGVTTRQRISAFDDGTIRDASDAALPVLKSGLPTGNLYDFDTYLNTLIIAQPGIKPLSYDGTAFQTLDQLTRAQLVRVHLSRLFYVDPDEPSRVRYTRIGALNDSPTLNFVDINTDDGQRITGLTTLYDQLVIFKEDSIFLLTGTDLDFDSVTVDFRVSQVNEAVGCVSFRSIETIRNTIYFMNEEGPYVFDGRNVAFIGQPIEDIFDPNSGDDIQINQRLLSEAISINCRELHLWMVGLVSASGVEIDTWICFHYEVKAWTIYKFADTFSVVTIVEDADDNERVLFGDYAGNIFTFGIGKNDNGTAITYRYESTWSSLGNDTILKRLRRLLVFNQGTGQDGMRIEAFLDFNDKAAVLDVTQNVVDDDSEWDKALWDSGIWDGIRRFVRNLKFGQGVANGTTRGRHVKVRFSGTNDSEEVVLEGWTVAYVAQGIFGTTQQNAVG